MQPTRHQSDAAEVDSITALLRAAQTGSVSALGQLLDGCREYLLLVANQELPRELRPKLGASDVVQETFLEAQRDFAKFNGLTEGDLLIWLRTVLLNNMRDTQRRYCAARRDVAREIPWGMPGDSRCAVPEVPAALETPSWLARLGERDDCVRRAVDELPEDYRDVIVARNLQLQSFVQIAEQMGRSPDAVRKLWARAIESLQDELEGCNDW